MQNPSALFGRGAGCTAGQGRSLVPSQVAVRELVAFWCTLALCDSFQRLSVFSVGVFQQELHQIYIVNLRVICEIMVWQKSGISHQLHYCITFV